MPGFFFAYKYRMSVDATVLSSDQWESIDARIQRVDEDRWISSRYAAEADRRKLIVLYAFVYELARVRTVVSEPGLGAIRFQWWRDALDEISKGLAPRQHDVVRAIAQLLLPVPPLVKLIDGYEHAFEAQDRSLEPEGRLMLLACFLLDPESAEKWKEQAQRLGMIFAMARRLPLGHDHNIPSLELFEIPTKLRPAAAHCVLARNYILGKKEPGALKKRWRVLRTVMNGRV